MKKEGGSWNQQGGAGGKPGLNGECPGDKVEEV